MQTPNIWDKHRTVKYEDHFETVFTPLDCTMEKKIDSGIFLALNQRISQSKSRNNLHNHEGKDLSSVNALTCSENRRRIASYRFYLIQTG